MHRAKGFLAFGVLYIAIWILWLQGFVKRHHCSNSKTCAHIYWTNNLVAVNYSARDRRGTLRYQLLCAFQCFQSKRNTMNKTEITEKLGTPNWGASHNLMSQWQFSIVTLQLCSVISNLKSLFIFPVQNGLVQFPWGLFPVNNEVMEINRTCISNRVKERK